MLNKTRHFMLKCPPVSPERTMFLKKPDFIYLAVYIFAFMKPEEQYLRQTVSETAEEHFLRRVYYYVFRDWTQKMLNKTVPMLPL